MRERSGRCFRFRGGTNFFPSINRPTEKHFRSSCARLLRVSDEHVGRETFVFFFFFKSYSLFHVCVYERTYTHARVPVFVLLAKKISEKHGMKFFVVRTRLCFFRESIS